MKLNSLPQPTTQTPLTSFELYKKESESSGKILEWVSRIRPFDSHFSTSSRFVSRSVTEPPKKKLKSRWDDDEEEVAREKERKQAKKQAALAAKLANERQELESKARTASRDSTPLVRTPGREQGGARPPAARRIHKRGRDAHPLIESCRSVYSYEVSCRPSFILPYLNEADDQR